MNAAESGPMGQSGAAAKLLVAAPSTANQQLNLAPWEVSPSNDETELGGIQIMNSCPLKIPTWSADIPAKQSNQALATITSNSRAVAAIPTQLLQLASRVDIGSCVLRRLDAVQRTPSSGPSVA